MRLYIYKITQCAEEQKPFTYDFTKTIESAWVWTTREQAERTRRSIEETGGITVSIPFQPGVSCTDFRVEAKPQGGFAMSCEHPYAKG